MDTNQAISLIDDNKFETLIALYLRNSYPHMIGLIQTGINAEGESIKCKVDGIKYVHELNQCVAVACTVSEEKDLKRKWLGGKKARGNPEKGDIAKASEEFESWREKTPVPSFKLYLATKLFLESNTELYKNAIQKGIDLGIEVEIIEASQLVTFLDFNAEGQFLRQELLNISAGRLSESLIKKIAFQSLQQHRNRFSIGTKANDEIVRSIENETLSAIKSNFPLIAIQANSGLGKSTLVRQVGAKINEAGNGICLWIPAEKIDVNKPLETTLLEVLRNYYPSLNSTAGEEAIAVAEKLPEGICFIIDDINRLPSSRIAFDALETISAQINTFKRKVTFVVPIWRNETRFPQSQNAKEGKWIVLSLSPFSSDEKRNLATGNSDSAFQKNSNIIETLEGDPLLCGLALSSVSVSPTSQTRAGIIRSIINNLLQRTFTEVSESRNILAVPSEYKEALGDLINLILERDKPELSWTEIKEELGERNANLLLILSDTNRLLWLDKRAEKSVLRWRHERLRDLIIAKYLADQILNNSEPLKINDILSTPGLAEGLSLTLIFIPAENQDSFINILAKNQHQALAEILRLNIAENSLIRQQVTEKLQAAFANWNSKRKFVPIPEWQTLRLFSRTDNEAVIEVLKNLPSNRFIILARFRNGDVSAGLELMEGWYSAFYSKLPEQVEEAFAKKREKNKAEVAKEIEDSITDIKSKKKALNLIGFIGWKELAASACKIWDDTSKDEQLMIIVPFIWSLNRCGTAETQSYLRAALLRAQEINDKQKTEGNVHHASDRHNYFYEPMRFSFQWKITVESAQTWILIARRKSKFSKQISYMLRYIDEPDAIETFIRLQAEADNDFLRIREFSEERLLDNKIKSKRGFEEYIPERVGTRNHLWHLIETEKNEKVRKWAFRFWRRMVKQEDLVRLKSRPKSDLLYDDILRLRVLLRDKTSASDLIIKMKEAPGDWCHLAYALYFEDKVADTLFENIEVAHSNIYGQSRIERLSRYLPIEGVRRLIKEKADWLRSTPKTWTALWGTDIPEALRFISECLMKAEPKDLEYYFLESGKFNPVTQRMLDTVQPFFYKFSEQEKVLFAVDVALEGYAEWAQANCPNPNVGGKPIKYWFTEKDGAEFLNKAVEKVPEGVEAVERMENFRDIEDERGLCFDVRHFLKSWLGATPSENKLTIAAMLLARTGKGEDFDWWKDYKPDVSKPIYELWSNASYLLRRRRWEKSDEGFSEN